MDNLGFLASGNLVQEVATTLKKTRKIVIKWKLSNAVTYNITKTKAILFLPIWNKKVTKKTSEIRLTIKKEVIKFNNQVTWWLEMRLDSRLTFNTHVKKRVKQAQTAEIKIKKLTRIYRFLTKLV